MEKKWKGWIHRLYIYLQMCLMGFLKIAPLNNSGTVALPAWQAKLQLCSGQVLMIRDWCWPGDKAIRDKKRRGKEHLKTWNEITWINMSKFYRKCPEVCTYFLQCLSKFMLTHWSISLFPSALLVLWIFSGFSGIALVTLHTARVGRNVSDYVWLPLVTQDLWLSH